MKAKFHKKQHLVYTMPEPRWNGRVYAPPSMWEVASIFLIVKAKIFRRSAVQCLTRFSIFQAYSLVDREVGYCQGSAFIVGLLLLQVGKQGRPIEILEQGSLLHERAHNPWTGRIHWRILFWNGRFSYGDFVHILPHRNSASALLNSESLSTLGHWQLLVMNHSIRKKMKWSWGGRGSFRSYCSPNVDIYYIWSGGWKGARTVHFYSPPGLSFQLPLPVWKGSSNGHYC